MEETKEVTITPDREMLITQRNSFRQKLVDSILDYKRHTAILEVDPEYQRQNPQNGKFSGIKELVESYRKVVVNARAYVEIIDDLLKADEAGTLEEAWSDTNLPVDEEKE